LQEFPEVPVYSKFLLAAKGVKLFMYNIFFSNTTEDQKRVDELKNILNDRLPNLPFYDLSIELPYLDDWKVYAEPLLAACDLFVCIVGKNTYNSEAVDWEIREACRLKRPLIVTRLSNYYLLPKCCEELKIQIIDWEINTVAGNIGEQLVSRALFLRHNWDKVTLIPVQFGTNTTLWFKVGSH